MGSGIQKHIREAYLELFYIIMYYNFMWIIYYDIITYKTFLKRVLGEKIRNQQGVYIKDIYGISKLIIQINQHYNHLKIEILEIYKLGTLLLELDYTMEILFYKRGKYMEQAMN